MSSKGAGNQTSDNADDDNYSDEISDGIANAGTGQMFADGGIVNQPTLGTVGENGPEYVGPADGMSPGSGGASPVPGGGSMNTIGGLSSTQSGLDTLNLLSSGGMAKQAQGMLGGRQLTASNYNPMYGPPPAGTPADPASPRPGSTPAPQAGGTGSAGLDALDARASAPPPPGSNYTDINGKPYPRTPPNANAQSLAAQGAMPQGGSYPSITGTPPPGSTPAPGGGNSATNASAGAGGNPQLAAIKGYAAANDLTIVKVFREEGVSGTVENMNRPAWQDLMALLHSNGVKTIIIERLDRLARDLMVQETAIADIGKNGFTLISVAEPDLMASDPTRVLMRQLMGAVAQYDKSQIVAKLRGARMRKKAKEGRCEGRKPFGYYDGEVKAMERMKELRATGFGFDRLAAALNAEGIPSRTGKPWHGVVVNRILTGKPAKQIP